MFLIKSFGLFGSSLNSYNFVCEIEFGLTEVCYTFSKKPEN